MSYRFILTAVRAEFLNMYIYEGKRNTVFALKFGDAHILSTTVHNAGKYPQWNENFELEVFNQTNKLEIELYEELEKNREYLGSAFLELSEMLKGSEGFWLKIRNQNDTTIGSVVLTCYRVEEPDPSRKITCDKIKALPLNYPKPVSKVQKEKKENRERQELHEAAVDIREHPDMFKKGLQQSRKEVEHVFEESYEKVKSEILDKNRESEDKETMMSLDDENEDRSRQKKAVSKKEYKELGQRDEEDREAELHDPARDRRKDVNLF
jgi:hypothetical protein